MLEALLKTGEKMKISAKTDYACRALLELAQHWPNTVPVQISSIADNQKIPVKFLTQILVSLKQSGLVESIRGQKGGYLLAKAPQVITLREVVANFEKTAVPARFKQGKADVFVTIWQDMEEETKKVLNKITFDDILKNERTLNKVHMFTI